MKKQTFLRLVAFVVLSVAFQILLFELYGRFVKPVNNASYGPQEEWFDPSLMRLNNMEKLQAFCDSVYGQKDIGENDSAHYANMTGKIMRLRFYHGYSYYNLGQNFLGWALAPIIHRDLSAIVIPNDILKHPNAACSQQSIVGMQLLQKKGFKVRKVGFYDPAVQSGHFCFEVFYGDKWHFFDPDKEPELEILERYNRPSIQEITSNFGLLDSVYRKEDSTVRRGYLLKYTYGDVNTFPAKKARIYQYATMVLSYTLFLWLLLIGWWLGKKLKKKKILPG